jgi:hypothetical protein
LGYDIDFFDCIIAQGQTPSRSLTAVNINV